MFTRRPVFAQIVSSLDPTEFARCAEPFPLRRPPRGLSAYDHFLAMIFGHLTHRESLRDLAACLQSERAYHAGFRSRTTRTNIAYANQHRDWRTFAAVAEVLMRRVGRVCQSEPQALELPEVCYALDASMIHLSLEIFPWAYWQTKAAALKMHTLLSLRSHSPAWTAVTEASFPEQKSLDLIPVEAGACYVMDRAYLDFPRLARWQKAGAYFVVRSLKNISFRVLKSSPVDKSGGLRSTYPSKTFPIASSLSTPTAPRANLRSATPTQPRVIDQSSEAAGNDDQFVVSQALAGRIIF